MSDLLATLAAAAIVERDERIRRYPGLVAGQKIAHHEAEADTRAWTAIAAFLRDGACQWANPDSVWKDLSRAAAEALRRREEASRKAPDDAALRRRRDNVAEISALFGRLVALDAMPHPTREDFYLGSMREAEDQLAAWKKALDA